MLQFSVRKHSLRFKFEARTSRGSMREKESWFIEVTDTETGETGIGECSVIKGLSPDFDNNFEKKIHTACEHLVENGFLSLSPYQKWPSILFGIETALLDLKSDNHILFPGNFTSGKQMIPINGLIWMGEESFMQKQIEEKIASGFSCLKLKVGALDFDRECEILKNIRKKYNADQLQLRVDANGAFSLIEVNSKLEILSGFDLHSIEQPIMPGQWDAMKALREGSPVQIALDEELIGIQETKEKEKMLDTIQPQFIILKPSLHGGISGCKQWIELAEKRNIGWWITSALESNIGLNAIAQWTASLNIFLHQGLGTGSIFENNFPSPLTINSGNLYYDPKKLWDLNLLHASAIS